MFILAALRYDFNSASWLAFFVEDPRHYGMGTTPEEAVENLRYQARKHDQFPVETMEIR